MADRSIYRVVRLPSGGAISTIPLKSFLLHLFSSQKPKATGFGQTIETVYVGDEAQAFAMYAGQFTAAGETISTTAPFLFQHHDASAQWQTEIHGLVWLQHFAASKRQLHNHFALKILLRWAKAKKPKHSLLQKAKIIHALATDGANIARCADPHQQAAFLKIVTTQVCQLVKRPTHGAHEAIIKSIAILTAASAFSGFEPLRKSAIDVLENTIDHVVLGDGGLKSADPSAIIEFLAALLPLKKAMNRERQAFPPKSFQATERALGLLAMLRHGDGSLAFSRCANIANGKLDAFLTHEEKHIVPLNLAPHTKIARLSKGKTLLVVKTADDAAFEFSDGQQTIFRSSLEGAILHSSNCDLQDIAAGVVLQQINRTYFLSSTGQDLRIEDRHSTPIELIFELCSNVKVTALRKSPDLLLLLPNRNVWKLSMRGAEARIEQNGRILRLLSTGQTCINWALKKQLRQTRSNTRKANLETDLLM